ncbi:MAG: hypothetical protein HYX88_02195 [Chloroflexi bacterium]|nr:hypothetical protein [Chloroflexota bacterium]
MFLSITYNPLPGKVTECDEWVKNKLVPFFCGHSECKGVQIYEDLLIGDPERMILVEATDVCAIKSLLESPEARALKRDFTSYATNFCSQILNITHSVR